MSAVAGLLTAAALCGCAGTMNPALLSDVRGTQTTGSPGAGTYVALGDSFTSAPLLPQELADPVGCWRSSADYPALVDKALRPRSFVNVSCYGASTYDMTHTEDTLVHDNPPQLNALSAADSLVTLQVGGDDIGFSHIVTTCATLSFSDPFGAPCEDRYTAGGTDQLAQDIARAAPKIASVLSSIRQRAPRARILLVGYPDILPTTGSGCWPEVPFTHDDVTYLAKTEVRLNSMLAAVAAKSGAGYVDTYGGSIGHDACEPSGVKWVEGLIPTSLAAPMHPNALGEQAMSREILGALR